MKDPLWAPWRLQYVKGDRESGCVFCPENYDSDYCLFQAKHNAVFLNRFPYANGHLLVAPRAHVSDLAALDEATWAEAGSLTRKLVTFLREWMQVQGFNIGYNLGEAAGAGIASHLHMHIVPRWAGDVNFMPVLADVKVIPQHIDETAQFLRARLPEVL